MYTVQTIIQLSWISSPHFLSHIVLDYIDSSIGQKPITELDIPDP